MNRFRKQVLLAGMMMLVMSTLAQAAGKPAKAAKKAATPPVVEAQQSTPDPAAAMSTTAGGIPANLKIDLEAGQQINGVCAACHGPAGQGGKKGEYPRIAGLAFGYLKDQLLKFKARKRINLPMFPYTLERELSDEDVNHIAAYVSQLKLETRPPQFKEDEDALVRLQAMEKVFNVPRAEGDVEAGAKTYKAECSSCHGAQGQGKKNMPMLAGQYTQYLTRQVGLFIKGERIHDEDLKDRTKDVLNLLKPEEIRDILAYLSILDDE